MMADFVPGYEASAWYRVGAPRNTPAEIVARIFEGGGTLATKAFET
jgi:hypothetical protein